MKNLFSLFSKTPENKYPGNEMDEVITFMKSLVVREDLIAGIIGDIASLKDGEDEKRLTNYIRTYYALEEFITSNKPMVVQKVYSKESLRQEIRSIVKDLNKLPDAFRLLLYTGTKQLLFVYGFYTRSLAKFIINQTGLSNLPQIINPLIKDTPLAQLKLSAAGPEFTDLLNNISGLSTDELTNISKRLNTALFDYIKNSFGEKTALDVTERSYAYIKERYDYDIISRFLTVLPANVLDRERIAYMTRGEIEEKVREQMKEIYHEREELEKAYAEINENYLQAKRSEAKLFASVSSLSLGFILADVENNIVIINKAAELILKLPGPVSKLSDLESKVNGLGLANNIELCRTAGTLKEIKEFCLNEFILNITFTPIFLTDPLKDYIGTVVLFEDITEAKQLERTKDDFFAIASHELRTPLTAILGSVSMLKNNYADKITESEMLKLIDYINQSAVRLIDIVNEFLSVSRIEQGRMVFKNERVNFKQIINDILEELNSLAQKKSLYLKLENTYPDDLYVIGDSDKIKQVIVNLAGNAIKFTDKGGVTIEAGVKDSSGYIKVKDTGKGIPLSNQKLLFRKFQQADDILTHDMSKGTGLGLYICKRLIDNMNGEIYLESSRENEGSAFTILLPLAPANQPKKQDGES